LSLALATSVIFSCGGRNAPGDAGTADELTRDERDLSDRGGDSSNATQQLTVLADSLFDFDPTIDAAKSAAENAAALESNVRSNLGGVDGGVPADGGSLGCGSVSLSGTTVTVNFGPPPGCTLRNGAKISGSVSVSVAKTANTISLTLSLTQVISNGVALSGTAAFNTSNGSTFTVDANVTSGATAYVLTNLSVTGGTGTTTINGSVAITGDSTTTMTFANLTWRRGDCYPNGGTVTSKKGLTTTVITFDANTPTTGLVKVTVGRKTSTVPLPVYGQCGARDGGP
jgi:hypothetical protein